MRTISDYSKQPKELKKERHLTTRFYSSRQEEAVAKAVGGKRTSNGGATDFKGKSDVEI